MAYQIEESICMAGIADGFYDIFFSLLSRVLVDECADVNEWDRLGGFEVFARHLVQLWYRPWSFEIADPKFIACISLYLRYGQGASYFVSGTFPKLCDIVLSAFWSKSPKKSCR
jgi:hypothetical protein